MVKKNVTYRFVTVKKNVTTIDNQNIIHKFVPSLKISLQYGTNIIW